MLLEHTGMARLKSHYGQQMPAASQVLRDTWQKQRLFLPPRNILYKSSPDEKQCFTSLLISSSHDGSCAILTRDERQHQPHIYPTNTKWSLDFFFWHTHFNRRIKWQRDRERNDPHFSSTRDTFVREALLGHHQHDKRDKTGEEKSIYISTTRSVTPFRFSHIQFHYLQHSQILTYEIAWRVRYGLQATIYTGMTD